MTEAVSGSWICGFWRRVGAYILDSLLIFVVGLLLGVFLESVFVAMGAWALLVGYSIALTYFGVMNSALAGGQTLAKKLLKIKVVNADNAPISVARSLLRSAVLQVPFYLNGTVFGNESFPEWLIYPLNLIVFGGIFAIPYLYIFNRTTRQSLHDVVAGTYVVNVDAERQEPEPVWRGHLLVVAAFFIAALTVPAWLFQQLETDKLEKLLAVQSALSDYPDVGIVTVTEGQTTVNSTLGSSTTTFVSSQVRLTIDNVDDEELARQMATRVVEVYPGALETDVIQVTLIYGYDIGIASQWTKYDHNFSPDTLQPAE
ncbi:RDD family protein [Alteromonas sp. ZYF713]|nr:RDD family protein [Alteromonas sp. ZYF713]